MECEGATGLHGLPSILKGQRLIENIHVICLQETRGKNEFVQALRLSHTQFHMVGNFLDDQINAGSSVILIRKIRLHNDARRPTQIFTQNGRDHLVKINSRERSKVIAK